MVYGIILIYYENYADKSIHEFYDLLKKIEPDSKLIVINNSSNKFSNNFDVVIGNNKNWEFSGWDVGLSTIEDINSSDIFIFCNDTFCHHNPWNENIKRKFIRTFSNVIKENNRHAFIGIAGTTDSVWKEFSIEDKTFSHWISSYLFLMTGSLLEKMGGSICIDENTLDNYVKLDRLNHLRWNECISSDLQLHLTGWMYGNGNGWYNKDNISPEKKIRKIKTILNEKYLTAVCNYNDGRVIEVKFIKRLKFFFWSLIFFSRKRKYHVQ
ncbi:hypothetical protein [Klebsiella sp. 2680]|uniref:hypothetical protein n=1 Tax=Klebsiella sp. 2680 TaxID=2018037 RepID=UPI00115B37A9|nr:hypothetical protein [Klebsiella sp. 2680]